MNFITQSGVPKNYRFAISTGGTRQFSDGEDQSQ